jgi:hypothetical protein
LLPRKPHGFDRLRAGFAHLLRRQFFRSRLDARVRILPARSPRVVVIGDRSLPADLLPNVRPLFAPRLGLVVPPPADDLIRPQRVA